MQQTYSIKAVVFSDPGAPRITPRRVELLSVAAQNSSSRASRTLNFERTEIHVPSKDRVSEYGKRLPYMET